MSDSNATASSGGIGVFGLLGVVFVTLKLLGITEVATWSWFWVTLPFWGGIALILALLGAALAFAGIVAAVVGALELWNSRQRNRRRKALEVRMQDRRRPL